MWAVVGGAPTPDDVARLETDLAVTKVVLERMLDDLDARYDSVRALPDGPERRSALDDFDDELDALEDLYERYVGFAPDPDPEPEPAPRQQQAPRAPAAPPAPVAIDPEASTVRVQASWSDDGIVVWAGGHEVPPATAEELTARLDAIGRVSTVWKPHPGVPLPGGKKADALSAPVGERLGWLVDVGNGVGADGVGASARWLGRVAIEAVRLVAQGAVVPTLSTEKDKAAPRRPAGGASVRVRWRAALVDDELVAPFAKSMPGPVGALVKAQANDLVRRVLDDVVHAILVESASRIELPAPPPVVRNSKDVAEAFVTRLDGSTFAAPAGPVGEVSSRVERWTAPVTKRNRRARLVVQLAAPDTGDAWFLRVLGRGATGDLLDVEKALADSRWTKPIADELARLERALPVLTRAGANRRGQVYLSNDEAWDLMTVTGPVLEAAGFEVRVPELSRRKPKPALRLFAEPTGDTVVGARQLNDVRWTALFDDVELTAADIRRLAVEARPLVRSRGKWVALDRADLQEAAAALAERANRTQMTGAEILRHAVGLEGGALGGGVVVHGGGWAAELLERAAAGPAEVVTKPEGFSGELRSYQAEALAWLAFLDSVELGGCLALDMGLGKTPTVIAHVARTRGQGPCLVVAPPAVVGNWASEARKFAPGLRVVVHHGADRAASADELASEVAGADLVITTYGTAVRDVDALSRQSWRRVVLDEAQAIKNPANETSQQLRRIGAPSRIALTGTPVENSLGDLWSILDFTNPGLVGTRSEFVSQLSGGEAALKALNGVLVFRRTKREPEVAAELPDRIDELDHCTMTPEQIGLYQAVLDGLVPADADGADGGKPAQGAILAAITALKQICNHPAAYKGDDLPLAGRSGKLARLEEIVETVFAAGEKILIFTHFATWGVQLASHLTDLTGVKIDCYHGGLARGVRDRMVADFQAGDGAGALVLSLKAGGTGLNLTAANHVVLYDRWWNPAVEDQARDRAWRIGQTKTVISHRLVCPGTVDERVEEVVANKRHIADLVLPKSSTLGDLSADQLRVALGLREDELLTEDAA